MVERNLKITDSPHIHSTKIKPRNGSRFLRATVIHSDKPESFKTWATVDWEIGMLDAL